MSKRGITSSAFLRSDFGAAEPSCVVAGFLAVRASGEAKETLTPDVKSLASNASDGSAELLALGTRKRALMPALSSTGEPRSGLRYFWKLYGEGAAATLLLLLGGAETGVSFGATVERSERLPGR